jgi:gliding motility-associated-like protein
MVRRHRLQRGAGGERADDLRAQRLHPDGDGTNDHFAPVALGIDPGDYRFMIFDRWGQPLFDTSEPNVAWDGNFANGDPTPQGVYPWKLFAKDPFSGEHVERIGHVALVR